MLNERVVQRLREARNLIDDILSDCPPEESKKDEYRGQTFFLNRNMTIDAQRAPAKRAFLQTSMVRFAVQEGDSYTYFEVPMIGNLDDFTETWCKAVSYYRSLYGNTYSD
jgi:hypothetical protein